MSNPFEIVNPNGSSAKQAALPALPEPRGEDPIHIRPATLGDYDFIDALQKANSKAVGFMWEKAIKGHIEKGNVLVAAPGKSAAGVRSSGLGVGERHAGDVDDATGSGMDTQAPNPQNPTPTPATPVGYVIGVDRYLKRDELGVIYQMNVTPEYRRSLVAANLLKAKFEASAYGCRLYCCWCAQDLEANRFWEAMGFVPLAFRTGGGRPRKNSKKKPRMHIFWQKRIRQGDKGDPAKGGTPYWFPSQTGAGAIGEDRIVLPIPPGTHWSDAKPIVLPEGPRKHDDGGEVKLLENEVQRLERERKAKVKQKQAEAIKRAKQKDQTQRTVKRGGLHFAPAPGSVNPGSATAGSVSPATAAAEQQAQAAVDAEIKAAKKAVKQARKKFDPAQEAFARELKDRWLEQVQAEPTLISPSPGSERYDVCRRIQGPVSGSPASSAQSNGLDQREVRIIETRRLEAA